MAPHESEVGPRTWAPARGFAALVAGRCSNVAPGRPGATAAAFVESLLKSAHDRRFVAVPQLPPCQVSS